MNAHLADQDRAKPARILRELIRKRAERRAGQTLKEMPKNKGEPKRAKNNAVLDDYSLHRNYPI